MDFKIMDLGSVVFILNNSFFPSAIENYFN